MASPSSFEPSPTLTSIPFYLHPPAALTAFVLVVPVFGVPTLVPITKRAGPVKTNSYIVTFRDAASKAAFMNSGPTFIQPGSGVAYNYDIIPAAAMMLNSASDLGLVQKVAGVKSIEPDSIASINYEVGLGGVEVVDHQPSARSSGLEKRWDQGEGVMIYGLDTGIYIEHNCFCGRAEWGKTFGGHADKDGNGHGTHIAGTAICSNFKPGVAGKARMKAVKVLSDAGSGPHSDIIAGIDWIAQQYQADPSIPTIATILSVPYPSNALDTAVSSAIDMGIHFTVGANFGNRPAETCSPAGVQNANTIGAVDSDNRKTPSSNHGPSIDVWHLGADVESAWIGGPDSTKVLSGTAMAASGVSAILAAFLSKDGNGKLTPVELTQKLKDHAQPVVKNEMGAPIMGSTNLLAVPF